MLTTTRWPVGLTILALALMACGVEPEDELIPEESEALLTGVIGFSDLVSVREDTVVGGCLGGGQWEVVVEFAAEERNDTAEVSVSWLIVPRMCVVRSEGLRFTLTGDPSVRYETVSTLVNFNLTDIEGSVVGIVNWQLGERDGVCAMDLVLDVEVDSSDDPENPTEVGVLRGSLCGHDVELDASPLL